MPVSRPVSQTGERLQLGKAALNTQCQEIPALLHIHMSLKTQIAAEFTATHKSHFQGIFTAPQPMKSIPLRTKKDCFGGPSPASFLKESTWFLEVLLVRAWRWMSTGSYLASGQD